MKHLFINQQEDSNKFWTVDINDKSQIITFGKIGTQGRQMTKTFDTALACINDTEKLILQKTNKGYTEIHEGDNIPQKIDISENEQAENFFWEMIQKAHKKAMSNLGEYDIAEHIDCLTTLLSKKGKQKLVAFEKVFLQSMDTLDTAEIVELSIILVNEYTNDNGKIVFKDYVSTDGFVYFRCWLILQGKAFFEEITKDINAFVNGKYSFDIGDTWAEGLLSVSNNANTMNREDADEYEITDLVSAQFPEIIHYDSLERALNRPVLGGDELQSAYPELVGEMIKIK